MFNYPLFLTSANISNQKELFSSLEIKKEFEKHLKNLDIIEAQIEKRPASNIFEFIKDSLEINFIRKNY
jgi:tRNA A37 threonylcarbamoyladenosine synthetase subunit TsaC/SUA5/YrdC